MVFEGNKDEADKCFQLSQSYFEQGNREKALKFAQKAQRLYPSQKFKGLFIYLLRIPMNIFIRDLLEFSLSLNIQKPQYRFSWRSLSFLISVGVVLFHLGM